MRLPWLLLHISRLFLHQHLASYPAHQRLGTRLHQHYTFSLYNYSCDNGNMTVQHYGNNGNVTSCNTVRSRENVEEHPQGVSG